MIRVLVVDDSVFFRTIVSDMLNKDPAIEVVGTASDGKEALEKTRILKPDVLTLDIQMPRMDGLSTLEALDTVPHRPKVLILSSLASGDAELTYRSLRLGADDFMLKPRNLSKLRGIDHDLVKKVMHLITIPCVSEKRPDTDFPANKVVVIGCSAGGPPMLDILLSQLKADLGAAVVITQHMPEGFTCALAERLNRISKMPVYESKNGEILRNNRIIVSKAGYHSIIKSLEGDVSQRRGYIIHSKSEHQHGVRPAVDKTFTSAAGIFGPNTLAVILSGMGSDGGKGFEAVKQAGGTTLVVREEDCLVYGMARSALERESVDKVVPFRKLTREIQKALAEMRG